MEVSLEPRRALPGYLAAGMLIVAKGLANQAADGSLEWKIESTPTGSVTINGKDLMKM